MDQKGGRLKIVFYAPFKPLTHPHPSGDRSIGAGLFAFFAGRGHRLKTVSSLRSRWIYWRFWEMPRALAERRRAERCCRCWQPDLWLTYHTYYKAPDILGPAICRSRQIPYIIFQGIYSTKRRRQFKTWPGFLLNRIALLTADHVFSNRLTDHRNLARVVAADRLTYVKPGIAPADFAYDSAARRELRESWQTGGAPVLLAAAMFRPGVKSDGLALLIDACRRLAGRFLLVIVGDGPDKRRLQRLARKKLGRRALFTGRVARSEMHRYYSAADVFVFPGIRETLGMVYLEAQSCGLPVVAFDNGGIPEVVLKGQTGFLTPPFRTGPFVQAMQILIDHPELRRRMGEAARVHVQTTHDVTVNYRTVEHIANSIASERRRP